MKSADGDRSNTNALLNEGRSGGQGAEMSNLLVIRRAIATDREALLDVWLRSVRATHTFVAAEDIHSMIPEVRNYVASRDSELWVLSGDPGPIVGFVGMSGSQIESLFLAPEFQRRGGGRRLVQHAQERHGEVTVRVNEQNAPARAFYEACGFVVEGRSELDEQGRPYPLLQMRCRGANTQRTSHRHLVSQSDVPGSATGL